MWIHRKNALSQGRLRNKQHVYVSMGTSCYSRSRQLPCSYINIASLSAKSVTVKQELFREIQSAMYRRLESDIGFDFHLHNLFFPPDY